MTLAIEAIERAGLRSELAARLIKSAAIIEFFRNGSGLSVADDILSLCVPEASIEDVRSTLDDLVNRAILIRQPRLGGYALFAGSDFDLDDAITQAAQKLSPEVLLNLPARLGIGPIAAKKHYFKTGALRVFDVALQFVEEAPQDVESWTDLAAASLVNSKRRSSGILVLLVMHDVAPREQLDHLAAKLSEKLELRGVLAAVAAADKVELLRDQAIDLHAIDRIEVSHPQLEGDRIARRELTSRRAQLTDAVRSELLDAFLSARWWILGIRNEKVDASDLSIVASTLAELAFHQAPVIQSELLYREKPSSSAMAGLRALAHAMVAKPDLDSLGIEGYPVERGLYLTILRPLGLHRQGEDGVYGFTDPSGSDAGATLAPAWRLLAEKEVRLSDLFDLWAGRPFGIKRGVMPVLALAYLMTHRNNVALYVDGRYQAVVDDVVVDRLMQDAGAIEFRRISRSKRDEEFTRQLARLLSTNETIVEPAALPVASSLYQRFHALPQWAQRTGTMSVKARQIRDIVLKASDPEALLFTDLPSALEGETDPATAIAGALLTAEAAYPAMLYQFRIRLAEMLGVNADTFEGIGSRSITASGISADLRVEAFIMRTGAFEGGGDVEGLASLLVHKPPRNWSDREQEQALFEMAKLARQFREAEAFANVKGRAPTSKAISVVVGLDPNERPLFHAFEVTEQEMESANDVADDLLLALRGRGLRSAVELAALARVVERLSVDTEMEQI
ncbi:hypothetical protein [Agrobacterium tumefaciens]|uniref:hypothetical protein n=1 Tax=Agrobacterium tumefaciens TaxID=358 RepID=UPI001177A64D